MESIHGRDGQRPRTRTGDVRTPEDWRARSDQPREADLASAATTANYSFITPDLCHDGHNSPCRNGEPGGLVSADAFLAHWIPIIMKSPAYRDAGLIIITFDEAASADASACCNEPSGPNTKLPGAHGPGGGRVGAVVLSPFIRPGTVSKVPYNHYSMLRSVEDLFGLKHIGYAGQRGLVPFGADVYTRPRRAKYRRVAPSVPLSSQRCINRSTTILGRRCFNIRM